MVSFSHGDEQRIPEPNKNGLTIFDLPDHFMVSVFKYFSLKQRLLQISL